MSTRKNALFFLLFAYLGLIAICMFFTPFMDKSNGELVHRQITFQGGLLVGRFFLYVAAMMAVCGAIVILSNKRLD